MRIPVPFARGHLAAIFGVPLTVLDRAAAVSRRERVVAPSVPPVEDTSGPGSAGPAPLAAEAPSTTRHVDPALVPYFQTQLEGHYAADMMLGPRALLGTVEAQCRLIGELVDQADAPTRRSMAEVGVSYATFAAWLHLDAGDPTAALRWHDTAQELAHRSHNRQAIACALVDRAMARTDQGAGAAVVDLCESALMDATHLSPEIQVFALQQQAHGASLLGERREVDQLLDTASRLLDRVDVEEWGTACLRTPNYVEVQRATCYGRLGLAHEAHRLWQQIIPAAPATSRRDVGVWSARQAVASAALGEPERAVGLARHAADVVLATGSARAVKELWAVATAMSPWQAEPVGQDLAEVLAPIGVGR
ncbi:Twin-arginine translocation pathway signal [Streptomyces inusitatus]|uniref:Twin-arginine translocation pathway signal n=1 Tax=Streptomyces inusitatus TaxID=68221 RepID=UPI00167F1365|nr:Twin-arginine translocation pathway signal [Streptomyces inusitatus]